MISGKVLSVAALIISIQACAQERGQTDAGSADGPGWAPELVLLTDGWVVQSSSKISDSLENISTPGYQASAWYPAKVPGTVFGSLVEAGVFPDVYYGMNLRSIPGMDYPIGTVFTDLEMPSDSPYRDWWHYRTDFTLGGGPEGTQYWLEFKGINFKARIYLNGRKVADSNKTAGTFRHFEYNITGHVREKAENGLAVSVFPETPTDLGITFVDWNVMPPDKDMGLWNDVVLKTTGPVIIRNPYVAVTDLETAAFSYARLAPVAELLNGSDKPVEGELEWLFENVKISKSMSLQPGELREIRLTPEEFPQLRMSNPRVWWPVHMGSQELYTAVVSFSVKGAVSDRGSFRFGVRKFNSEFLSDNTRVFLVNGRKVLIRGAGYTPDMMLRRSDARNAAEIDYVKHMNLNAIRLEGKLGDEHLLNLCDEQGILVIAGWCCCDAWERWYLWDENSKATALESLKAQIRDLRRHASVIAWLNASDKPPPSDVEKGYLAELDDAGWPRELTVSSADDQATEVTGPSGVKMTGPYDWVPPNYWLLDKKAGGAFGFNTETSPGPAVPPVESLKRMLPPDHYWPIDDVWNFHAGGGEFTNIDKYSKALERRYGPATGMDDFAAKSQLMAYEGIRAMFEAYGRNKYVSTGVIQWMLNNAWPSIIWHLYDYYLKPGGGYFGARKANEPLHIQYSYDDGSVVVVNSHREGFGGLNASAEVLNLDSTTKFSKTADLMVEPDSVIKAFTIPEIPGLSKTYFVRLKLKSAGGDVISENLYWLSTDPDVPDFDKTEWYYTPVKSYADLTALASLPPARIDVAAKVISAASAGSELKILLSNPSDRPAFFIRAEAAGGDDGSELLPVMYDDNYVTLWPGESKTLTAILKGTDINLKKPFVRTYGINVPLNETFPERALYAPKGAKHD